MPDLSAIITNVIASIASWIIKTRIAKMFGLNKLPKNSGGRGGTSIARNGGKSIGGRGGKGGLGPGGNGGHSFATGKGSLSIGGEGGEGAQKNKRAKGGRGPLHVLMKEHPEEFKEISEKFGITEEMAKRIGKGGDGAGPVSEAKKI